MTLLDPRLLHTRDLAGPPLIFGGVMAGSNLSWFARLFEGSRTDFFW